MRKIHLPTTLPPRLRADVDALAAAERRARTVMMAILIEEALDAHAKLQVEGVRRSIPPIEKPKKKPGQARAPRTSVTLRGLVHARVVVLAHEEQRTQDEMVAMLTRAGLEARRTQSTSAGSSRQTA